MKLAKQWFAIACAALMFTGCNSAKVHAEAVWQTDSETALQMAAAEQKPILMQFSGSDWCGWCIKLEDEVFSQPEFIEFAQQNLVLLQVDFPRHEALPEAQQAANKALADRYAVRGFPTVLLLDAQGNVLERTGYQRGGAAAYVEMIQKAIR